MQSGIFLRVCPGDPFKYQAEDEFHSARNSAPQLRATRFHKALEKPSVWGCVRSAFHQVYCAG